MSPSIMLSRAALLSQALFRPRSVLTPLPSSFQRAIRSFCSASSRDDDDGANKSTKHNKSPNAANNDDATSPTDIIVPPTPPSSSSEQVVGRRPVMEPRDLLSIPLFTRPHFPKIIAPIIVHDPAACKAFASLRDTGLRHVGLFLHKQAGIDLLPNDHAYPYNDAEQLHRVGVLAEIIRLMPRQKGVELTFLCHHRIRWNRVVSSQPLLTLATEPIAEPPADLSSDLIKAYSLSVIETMKELLRLGSFYKEQLELLLESVDVNNPYHLADLGACLTTADPASLQDVLEETDIAERLRLTLELLKKDLETTRVSRRIHKQIEENVSKSQRKYFLTEQMKQIKRELGMEKDEKETLLTKFKARLEHKVVPDAISNIINDEMEKLSSLEPSSSEYNVTRNYLDWLTELPWGVYSQDSLDIARAEKVLDEMHYGLKDVKERILEFIAVSGLRGNVQGKILLLSGPPGVGKTSIGRSIAKALNREFYRFSVGGMGDVAEIKGHRRTYVGAMPGKFVQALKNAKAANPVIMIDEIDKMGRGWTGDPSSALLEALDPEQNSSFLDHYMDVPIDLSKVLFLCTANVLDTIPGPLLDRMQSIPLSGYILEEKVAIADKYLVPTARTEAGLTEEQVKITEDGLVSLARDYCREAGVRSLKQQIEKIFRKVALRIVKDKPAEAIGNEDTEQAATEVDQTVITSDNVEDYLGKKQFTKERLFDQTPPGIATGLAWTSMGGATLYIECVRIEGAGEKDVTLKVTGQLGDVMKESTDIALSYARNYVKEIALGNDFFESCSLHMHIPEGATPKDGPSAGCTMVSALLSLAINKPIRQNVAMTGEVTLTGQVLPVGGIREKTIAAKRSGIKHIILPNGNRKDWDELPEHVAKDIVPHFAEHYDDVYRICFAEGPDESEEQVDKHARPNEIDVKPDSATMVSLSRMVANAGLQR
eukprot:TRINITY_DN2951_c0_g1_i1.p1 TRINITY_DN2951_c0_g1~~TRINITY_DN2951_c0_g1_i1.p1  ORF type:complete len:938 (+),score=167.39 TRINITY_DN2951_c0_g1_i1:279-3092(+)